MGEFMRPLNRPVKRARSYQPLSTPVVQERVTDDEVSRHSNYFVTVAARRAAGQGQPISWGNFWNSREIGNCCLFS